MNNVVVHYSAIKQVLKSRSVISVWFLHLFLIFIYSCLDLYMYCCEQGSLLCFYTGKGLGLSTCMDRLLDQIKLTDVGGDQSHGVQVGELHVLGQGLGILFQQISQPSCPSLGLDLGPP